MLDTINATSRVWVYQSNRALENEEWELVTQKLNDFMKEWNAHGNALTASFEIKPPFHFALIVDEEQSAASGCSIDSSVHQVKALEDKLKVSFFDRQNIAYQYNDEIHLDSMNDFISKIKNGQLPADTLMANTLVDTYEKWNESLWVTANESWLSVRL